MKKIILLLLLFILTTSASFAQSKQSIGVDTLKLGNSASAYDPTIEMSGTNVKIKANKTTGKAQFTNDGSVWKNLGAGSGSGAAGQTFNLNGSFEDGFAVNHSYSSGVASEVTGTSALEGDKSPVLNFAAQNDYYRSDYFTVPKGLYGSACELRFKYRDGNAHTYVKVENEAGVVIGQYQRPEAGAIVYGLQTLASPGYESVYFKCPTQADVTASALNGNIRYVVYQGTSTDAAALTLDLVSIGELIGLTETTTSDSFSAKISNTGVVTDEKGDFLGTCSVSDTSLFTCTINSGIFTVTPNCTLSANDTNGTDAIITKIINTTSTSQLVYRTGYTSTPPQITKAAYAVIVSCDKQGVDAKQTVQVFKSIPKISENVNDFNADMSIAGVASNEDPGDWIASCVQSATANQTTTCTFTAGIFTVAPACWSGSSDPTFNGNVVNLNSTSTTVSWTTWNDGTSDANAIRLFCRKRGVDFKLPTVQPMVIGQVTNSAAESGLTNVRTEHCKINDNGASSVDTGSGLCPGWVASVSKGGTGENTISFIAGIFSAAPVCQVTQLGTDNINCFPRDTVTNTQIITTCENTNTATNVNIPFTLSCTGKR